MMDWDHLRVFYVVAEAGSLTQAGNVLNLSQSAISRQISSLEYRLGVALFHRHARGLTLTEQGELLFEAARETFAKLTMVEARLQERTNKPSGPLTITTTVAFGSLWLTPRIAGFIRHYPDIEVNLILADNELDLSMREADVAIRLEPPTKPGVIQSRLMTIGYHPYAASSYLDTRGIPQHLEDLDDHDLVVYGDDAHPPAPNLNWLLMVGRTKGLAPRKPLLRVNSIYGIFRAVHSGIGIGALPSYMSTEAANLVRILPGEKSPDLSLYFVYPEELKNTARIIAFRDYVKAELGLK